MLEKLSEPDKVAQKAKLPEQKRTRRKKMSEPEKVAQQVKWAEQKALHKPDGAVRA